MANTLVLNPLTGEFDVAGVNTTPGPAGINGVGLTAQTVGFTAAAGTTSKTLTVTANVTLNQATADLLTNLTAGSTLDLATSVRETPSATDTKIPTEKAVRTALDLKQDAASAIKLGTTSGTALAGDTPLLQLGTTAQTALAGNTSIPAAYVLPTASTTVKGGVKVDGTTITITNDVISSTGVSSGVSSVSGTAPIVSSGGATPAISISAATTSAAGSMSSADKTKLDGVSGTNTGDQLTFKTISVSGQSDVVADTTTDTLTLVAGTNVTITTDAATDTITIASSGGSSGASLTQGTLAGRGAASGSGVYEGITLGTNLSMSGTTLNATGGGGMTYPSAGVPVSTGSAWGTSLNITAISDSTSATSSTTAASVTAVKAAYDNGATQASSAITTHNADTTNSHLSAAQKAAAIRLASSGQTGLMSTTYADKLDNIQASAAAVTSTTPTTQAFGDAAAVGTGTTAARSDHKHAMMASPKDTTAITGILKGNGSAISAATADTDYTTPTGTGNVQNKQFKSYTEAVGGNADLVTATNGTLVMTNGNVQYFTLPANSTAMILTLPAAVQGTSLTVILKGQGGSGALTINPPADKTLIWEPAAGSAPTLVQTSGHYNTYTFWCPVTDVWLGNGTMG